MASDAPSQHTHRCSEIFAVGCTQYTPRSDKEPRQISHNNPERDLADERNRKRSLHTCRAHTFTFIPSAYARHRMHRGAHASQTAPAVCSFDAWRGQTSPRHHGLDVHCGGGGPLLKSRMRARVCSLRRLFHRADALPLFSLCTRARTMIFPSEVSASPCFFLSRLRSGRGRTDIPLIRIVRAIHAKSRSAGWLAVWVFHCSRRRVLRWRRAE